MTIVLRFTALLLFLIYLHFAAETLTRKRGILTGLLFLVVSLIAIRLLIYQVPNIFYFRQFNLFDPTVYSTNFINPSLGDLLINSIMFCWLVVFAWFHLGAGKRLPFYLKGKTLIFVAIASALFLVWITFYLTNVIRSLVIDSKISFYVTDFFSLDVYTIIGFIVLALISLTYYYLTRLLLQLMQPVFKRRSIYIYFIITLIGLVFIILRGDSRMVPFQIAILIWLLAYTFILTQQKLIINRFKITVAGMLFWIFIFSLSLAVIILFQNKEKELLKRKELATKLDEITSPAFSLSIGLQPLNNRFLQTNFKRFLDPLQNNYLRDSIFKETISSVDLSKFSIKLYVFDSAGTTVNNADPMSYSEINNIHATSQQTDINYIFAHETSFNNFSYIIKRSVPDTGGKGPSMFIVATPKKYNEDALYPELLRKINRDDAENSPIYSYAVYIKNKLTNSSSKYAFKVDLLPEDKPKQEYEERTNGEYEELWYRVSGSKIIVVVKKRDTLIESITLFSYLFCAFLFMILMIRIISGLLKISSDQYLFRNIWQVNIRSQVHNTIIFISILSFLIIGIATISFFISRYNRNNIDKLSKTSSIMVKEIEKRSDNFASFDSLLTAYDPSSSYNLQRIIDEVADIHDADVNVYNLSGDLIVSSEINVYHSGILSTKMHPEAYYHLKRMRQVQYVQDETMSSLEYLSIYSAIRDKKGNVYAYLNIPYFLSQVDLNQEISNFLITIINLNAFIFLISGIIALFITNRITRSFSVIGDKMKDITFGKTNEEIEWKRNDEIGELVKYYNKMVHQLEQSAAALAKSEREGAWREMARQVAHEIKNPLTPMKLSIQYLQKAIVNNQPNVKELTANVANTLVEQIDHLSRIAADFARFANIGNRNDETFDLHPVLESLYALYRANQDVVLQWQKTADALVIHADKTQMNRLFSNLLTNAIDACKDRSTCLVQIIEERGDEEVLIQIKDNGEGIPEEMQPKIFTPNFTTKTSGTGLGLAMCKSIVEQAGGHIWFVTEPGVGTTFFVQLSLAD
jgi:signal transduction histidine kinase